MSSLFDEFGFDFGEVEQMASKAAPKGAPKEAKKEAKKKQTKAKKSTTDFEAEEKLFYPVTVKMPFKTLELTGEGEVSVKDVLSDVFQSGYQEISLMCYSAEDHILYIGIGPAASASERREAVDLNHPVKICIGDLRAEYNIAHFDGEEVVALEDVIAKFTEENPKFSMAEWLYQPNVNVITPFFRGFPEKTTEGNAVLQGMDSISAFGYKKSLSKDGTSPVSELTEKIGDDYSYYFGQIDKTLLATLKMPAKAARITVREDWMVNKGATGDPVMEKYKLPLKLWLYNFNIEREVSASDFGGKTRITEEDVREYLKNDISAFADSGRTFDFIYSRTQNTLSVGINSGKKGAAIAASVPGNAAEEEDFEDEPCYIYNACPMCRKTHRIALSSAEYFEFDARYAKGESVIRIFPQMNKFEREFLISGYCPECQEKIFGSSIPNNLRIGRT